MMSFFASTSFHATIFPTTSIRAAYLRAPRRDLSKWSTRPTLTDAVRKRFKDASDPTTNPSSSKLSRHSQGNPKSMSKGKEKAKEVDPDEHPHPQEKPSLSQYPSYRRHRDEIKRLFPAGWNPTRKLSREAMDGLRLLNKHDPETFNTPTLAERFKISPEAVRRILRSKWTPSKEEQAKLLEKERKRRVEAIARKREREEAEEREKYQKRVQEKEMYREREGLTLK